MESQEDTLEDPSVLKKAKTDTSEAMEDIPPEVEVKDNKDDVKDDSVVEKSSVATEDEDDVQKKGEHDDGVDDDDDGDVDDDELKSEDLDVMRALIEHWIRENAYAGVRLQSLEPFSAQFTIGPIQIPFEVGMDSCAKPLYLSSEHELLSEHVPIINFWISDNRERDDFTLLNLLNYFGIQFHEVARAYIEQQRTSSAATASSASPSTAAEDAIPVDRQRITQQLDDYFRRTDEEQDAQWEPRVPTHDDWETIIIPNVQVYLETENYPAYEIDEWIRRIRQHTMKEEHKEAIDLIQSQILGGARGPEPLHPFIGPRRSYARWRTRRNGPHEVKWRIPRGATSEAVDRLKAEVTMMETMKEEDCLFSAHPLNFDLFHWEIRLSGWDPQARLGLQLMDHAIQRTSFSDTVTQVKPTPVRIEVKFPPDFPSSSPLFRIIGPRFRNLSALSLSSSSSDADERARLTVSRAMEREWDEDASVAEMALELRRQLEESAEVDTSAQEEGVTSLATVGGFWEQYVAVSPQTFGREELEHAAQMVLPTSALQRLYDDGALAARWRSHSASGESPMVFEVSTLSGRRSFCGVAEFTAPDQQCIIPQWILNNLEVQEGFHVHVRRVQLPKGTFMRLQPHDVSFLGIRDQKTVLEWVLRRYTAVSEGDVLVVPHAGKVYRFNILEVRPTKAIRLIDSDVAVDFTEPLEGDAEAYVADMLARDKAQQEAAEAAAQQQAQQAQQQGSQLSSHVVQGAEGVDWNACGNCRKRIPVAAYDRHTLTCERFNWYCELCCTVVEKRQREQHMTDAHTEHTCDCGAVVDAFQLKSHQAADCPLRQTTCQWCSLSMPYRELWEHDQMCGGKSEQCPVCSKRVARREMESHVLMCTSGTADTGNDSSTSTTSSFTTRHHSSSSNDLLPCPYCDAPFPALDLLQVHIICEHPVEHQQAEDEALAATTAPQEGGEEEGVCTDEAKEGGGDDGGGDDVVD